MWRAVRTGPERGETRIYGPFAERADADRVAMNAAIKHGTSSVTVEPARKP